MLFMWLQSVGVHRDSAEVYDANQLLSPHEMETAVWCKGCSPSVTSTLPNSCTGGLLGTLLGAKSTSGLWRIWFAVTGNDTVPEAGTLDIVLGYIDEGHETALLALQVWTLILVFSSPESLLCFCNLHICDGTNTSGHSFDEYAGRYLSILFESDNTKELQFCRRFWGTSSIDTVSWLDSCKCAVISFDALSSIEYLYKPLPGTVSPFSVEAKVLVRNLSKFVSN